MMYNYRCEDCGAFLDPGERCTCHSTHEKNLQMVDELLTEDQDGQMMLKEAVQRMKRKKIERHNTYMEEEYGYE